MTIEQAAECSYCRAFIESGEPRGFITHKLDADAGTLAYLRDHKGRSPEAVVAPVTAVVCCACFAEHSRAFHRTIRGDGPLPLGKALVAFGEATAHCTTCNRPFRVGEVRRAAAFMFAPPHTHHEKTKAEYVDALSDALGQAPALAMLCIDCGYRLTQLVLAMTYPTADSGAPRG